MIAPDILPALLLVGFMLIICPILTTIFIYYRFGVANKSTTQKIFISFASLLLTFVLMLMLQLQFPYLASIWFILYLIVIATLTIVAYRERKRASRT